MIVSYPQYPPPRQEIRLDRSRISPVCNVNTGHFRCRIPALYNICNMTGPDARFQDLLTGKPVCVQQLPCCFRRRGVIIKLHSLARSVSSCYICSRYHVSPFPGTQKKRGAKGNLLWFPLDPSLRPQLYHAFLNLSIEKFSISVFLSLNVSTQAREYPVPHAA